MAFSVTTLRPGLPFHSGFPHFLQADMAFSVAALFRPGTYEQIPKARVKLYPAIALYILPGACVKYGNPVESGVVQHMEFHPCTGHRIPLFICNSDRKPNRFGV